MDSKADSSTDDANKAPELKEYTYYVGHMPVTAQLTDKQAEKLGATPAGTEPAEPPTLRTNAGRRGSPITSTGGAQDDQRARMRARQARDK